MKLSERLKLYLTKNIADSDIELIMKDVDELIESKLDTQRKGFVEKYKDFDKISKELNELKAESSQKDLQNFLKENNINENFYDLISDKLLTLDKDGRDKIISEWQEKKPELFNSINSTDSNKPLKTSKETDTNNKNNLNVDYDTSKGNVLC